MKVYPFRPDRREAAGRGGHAAMLAAVVWGGVLAAALVTETAHAADHAVVVMYHRFGEDGYSATNIEIEQFESHLAELRSGRYHVMPLEEIVAALKNGTPLPDRAVAITIDDAFTSVYREAWPRLKAEGLPFTLFIATDPLDRGSPDYMTWDQVRELAADGVTIGSQTASHPHMPDLSPAAMREELRRSNERFEVALGKKPALFAYPYGEFDQVSREVVEDMGFAAAFGQHSGVMYRGHDMFMLPRFAFNEAYGTVDRFRLAVNALPLRVTDITPADTKLSPETNPPPYGFTVDAGVGRLDGLACYASSFGKAKIERIGERRIEVRVPSAFPPGRSRINCTLMGPDNRWRWFGLQFYVPGRGGRAPRE